jgi:hypothetical protein
MDDDNEYLEIRDEESCFSVIRSSDACCRSFRADLGEKGFELCSSRVCGGNVLRAVESKEHFRTWLTDMPIDVVTVSREDDAGKVINVAFAAPVANKRDRSTKEYLRSGLSATVLGAGDRFGQNIERDGVLVCPDVRPVDNNGDSAVGFGEKNVI